MAVGTVEDLTVANIVRGTSHRYHLLRLDTGAALPLTGEAAETLQEGATVAVTGRQQGSHFVVEHASDLGQSRGSGAPSTAEVEGTLAIAHADDFESGVSQYLYHVQDDAGRVTTLNFSAFPAELRGGSRVHVSGRPGSDGVSLDAQAITVLSEPTTSSVTSPTLAALSATTNKVLVILANFSNTTAPSYTQSQAQQVMTTNANSVANFFSEVSYGGQLLNVTVTSTWVKMSIAATCSYTSIATAANAAAQALNSAYTASNYNYVVYVFPQQGCGWSGLAYVGYPHQAFINGTGAFGTQVITHEMGHNLGLLHAGSLNCGSSVIGGSCSASEYGDPWDTMGNQRSMHYNAVQKSVLGWIPSTSVKTHSTGSASYTLSPLETGGGATYAVKIPTSSSSRTYWLEFRQPIGFDAPLSAYPTNGVQVRVSDPFQWSSGSDDSEILDMTPGSSGGFGDSALVVGKSYLDSTYGVNIIVTSASSSAVTVSVTKGAGTTSTTTTLTSTPNPSSAGAAVSFTATVTGSSPTGTVNFKDGGSPISGCSAVAISGSGNARTAACVTSALTAGTHSIVATYSGDAVNAGSSSSALSQTVNGTTSTTSIATSLTPSTVGTSVTFTGTVSGNAPTGTVNFKDGGTSISGCSAIALAGSGNIRTASCVTAGLAAGSHTINASYSGNTGNSASTSSSLTQTVNKVTSSTGLSTSLNPSIAGSVVTFTASVTGKTPTGTVSFTDGGTAISGCSAAALAGSGNTKTAQCATSALASGTHSIVAHYTGDSANSASASGTLSQTVSPLSAPAALVNPSFEVPAVSTIQYNPMASGIGWTFSTYSGIQHNGSAWGAAPAPDGSQTAFIQSTSTIKQTVTLTAGSHTLSFKASRATCCVSPYIQPIKVTVDGAQIGSLISPSSTSFVAFSIPFSVATSGSHTITFAGTDSSNKTTFIDAVSIQ